MYDWICSDMSGISDITAKILISVLIFVKCAPAIDNVIEFDA
jgi:hypothetical protein